MKFPEHGYFGEKKFKAMAATSVVSPDGYYYVSNQGVVRLSAEKVEADNYRVTGYLERGASILAGLSPGEALMQGSWYPTQQRFSVQWRKLFKRASHCGIWDVYQDITIKPLPKTAGVWTVSRESGERECIIERINQRTCEVVACERWDDDPAYAVASSLLVRDRELAFHLFDRLEQWTDANHGLGSV